jgi:hypothetical protein
MSSSMTASTFNLNLQTSTSTSSLLLSSSSASVPSQLTSLFFLIQVSLRYLTSNVFLDLEVANHLSKSSQKQRQQHQQQQQQQQKQQKFALQRHNMMKSNSKLDTLLDEPLPQHTTTTTPMGAANTTTSSSSNPSSYPTTTNSTMNILQSPSSLTSSSKQLHQNLIDHSPASPSSSGRLASLSHKLSGALIDIDLYQTRYCSRLTRKACFIECLLSLDHVRGEYIELRACAPELWREELFYFVQDLYALIEHICLDTCPNLNLERIYLNFRPVRLPPAAASDGSTTTRSGLNLGLVSYDNLYTQHDLIQMQLEASRGARSDTKTTTTTKLIDLVFCGSENIEKNAIYGIDLDFARLSEYTRRMMCTYLDRADPMGRDWSILAFLLGLQDILPKLEKENWQLNTTNSTSSKCECVLVEWSRQKPEQASVRNLLGKINDLGRKDVYEMALNTIALFKMKLSKDSGIQNSNQTLASLK